MCPDDSPAHGSVLRPASLHQGSSGFWGCLFGLVAGCFLVFRSWPSGCFFLVWGFGVSAPCDFPVFLFLCFLLGFPASGVFVFLLALLHLASFSPRLGQEHSPVLPAAMDPGPLWPCTGVFRVARLLLGVVPGTRRCTAGGVRGIHCDPLHDNHYCCLSPR